MQLTDDDVKLLLRAVTAWPNKRALYEHGVTVVGIVFPESGYTQSPAHQNVFFAKTDTTLLLVSKSAAGANGMLHDSLLLLTGNMSSGCSLSVPKPSRFACCCSLHSCERRT